MIGAPSLPVSGSEAKLYLQNPAATAALFFCFSGIPKNKNGIPKGIAVPLRSTADPVGRPLSRQARRSNPGVLHPLDLPFFLHKKWHPQGDSNPCCRDENPVS